MVFGGEVATDRKSFVGWAAAMDCCGCFDAVLAVTNVCDVGDVNCGRFMLL
jgi:hypothetical protein